jgi:glycerol-3-phosphate O-acyltransferase/dihydroxyacetone phosphate acyltransferase
MSLELLFNWLSRFIVHIFFREYESRNTHKIPPTGPIIFICNHNNQFLDPAVVQEFSPRPISWLIAAKSYRDKTIGRFARAQRAIPVERPQDLAKPGPGKAFHTDPNDLYLITGTDEVDFVRDFTGEVIPGNKTNSFSFFGETFGVKEVLNINTIRLKPHEEAQSPVFTPQDKAFGYKITPKVDQHVMFQNVWEALAEGNCVGIFPEGGSHDQTTMLPLKAGVAIMALGAVAKMLTQYELDNNICFSDLIPLPMSPTSTSTPSSTSNGNNTSFDEHPEYQKFKSINLIAVGLNYFHGHRFRGRVYAEFGDPFRVPITLALQFRKGGSHKIDACNQLLDIIRDQLKTVTVSAPSWKQLQVLWAVRRLYQPTGMKLPPKLVVVLIRRFAEGYELVKDRQDVKELVNEVEQYNQTLKNFGLRDHQVNITQQSRLAALTKLIYRTMKLTCLGLLAIPGSILNLPIALITRLISKKKANEALKASTVKVTARDVIASWKVLTALTVVPLMLCIHPLLFATACKYLFGWSWIVVWGNFVILQPAMMWSAVLLVETGIPIFKSLQPLYLAVFPPNDGVQENTTSPKNSNNNNNNNNDQNDNSTQNSKKSTQTSLPHIVQLRQTRARLRYKIRETVNILGPEIYGPAFNQLRLFPFTSNRSFNSISPQLLAHADSLSIKAGSANLVQSDDILPRLMPQIHQDQSDTDSVGSDDNVVGTTPHSNDGDVVSGGVDTIQTPPQGKSIKIDPNQGVLTTGLPRGSGGIGGINGTGYTVDEKSDTPDSVQKLSLSTTHLSPFTTPKRDKTNPVELPLLSPTDSDDSGISNEFIIGENGEYVYNHDNKIRQLHLPHEAISQLYKTPLLPTMSAVSSSQNAKNGNGGSRDDDDDSDNDSDIDDEQGHMVMIDGVAVTQAQKSVLSSQALQPLTDLD